jgi:hypothetical protein
MSDHNSDVRCPKSELAAKGIFITAPSCEPSKFSPVTGKFTFDPIDL